MKINLSELWNTLKLPLGALAVFSALLLWFGTPLEDVLKIIEGLAGVAALVSLGLDVLKYTGALPDGYAGKVSAVINLVLILGVASVLKLYPSFDFVSVDAAVAEFAKVAGLLFAYIIQVVGSKQIHLAYVRGLGVYDFSHSAG